MPTELSRHKSNKSFYFTKERKFYWTLELLYDNHSFIVHQVDDSKTFGNIWGNDIKTAIKEAQIEPFCQLIQSNASLQFSVINRHSCAQINKIPDSKPTAADSLVLLTVDSVQIYSTEKLQNVLCGMTILEFPTIKISHANKWYRLRLHGYSVSVRWVLNGYYSVFLLPGHSFRYRRICWILCVKNAYLATIYHVYAIESHDSPMFQAISGFRYLHKNINLPSERTEWIWANGNMKEQYLDISHYEWRMTNQAQKVFNIRCEIFPACDENTIPLKSYLKWKSTSVGIGAYRASVLVCIC